MSSTLMWNVSSVLPEISCLNTSNKLKFSHTIQTKHTHLYLAVSGLWAVHWQPHVLSNSSFSGLDSSETSVSWYRIRHGGSNLGYRGLESYHDNQKQRVIQDWKTKQKSPRKLYRENLKSSSYILIHVPTYTHKKQCKCGKMLTTGQSRSRI